MVEHVEPGPSRLAELAHEGGGLSRHEPLDLQLARERDCIHFAGRHAFEQRGDGGGVRGIAIDVRRDRGQFRAAFAQDAAAPDDEGVVLHPRADAVVQRRMHRPLGNLVGHATAKAEGQLQMPLLLIRAGDLRAAVSVDHVIGNREIVVKPVGPQVASVPGIFGATIMGDGRVVVILDVAPLVRRGHEVRW